MGYDTCQSADTCINTNGTYNCSCLPGYQLTANGKTCVGMCNACMLPIYKYQCADINECAANNGDCAHICTNSDGGHQCLCRIGFTLALDGRSCHGM